MDEVIKDKEKKLDLKNKRILYELDIDSRKTISEIAKNVKMSKQAVEYRINNLLKENIITGFYTIINLHKLGYTLYRVALKLQNMPVEKEHEIVETLRKKQNVGWVFTLNGKWDIAFTIYAKNVVEFEEISANILNKYSSNIMDKSVSIVTSLSTFRNKFIYEEVTKTEPDRAITVGGEIKEEKIGSDDIKLLKIMALNSRTPLIEIAEKIKVSPKTVKNKIQNFIDKGIICGFKTNINTEIFGYDHYKIFLYLQKINEEKEKELINYLKKVQGVIYCTKAVGTADIEFEIKVKSINEFYRKMNQLKKEFSDLIKDYESLVIVKEEMINYFPF